MVRRFIGGALIATGAVLLLYCGVVTYQGWKLSHDSKRWLDSMLRQEQTKERAAMKPPLRARRAQRLPRNGELLAQLEIPRLRLSVPVLEGVEDSDLRIAAGHIPGTAYPWTAGAGNIGIAAHRDRYFRPLKDIRRDDEILLETPTGVRHYRVSGTEIVTPNDTRVLKPDGSEELTLVTCYPFYYVGSAPKRFIVHARQGS